MATMAPFPRVYFRYVEPLMMTFGALGLIFNGATASSTYLSTPPHSPLPTEHFLALQAANMMLLSALLLTAVMWTSRDPKTIRYTVMALALSDIPHEIAGAWCLGPLAFTPSRWSTEMLGFMGVPAVTFVIKVAYLIGWLGRDVVVMDDNDRKGQ